ncbi:hypothetical protein LV478_11640 [Komagataeibacter oboediens]|uniref:hypothetical protein n=1 Tax=Komagataeibacter oboediens TaxID=65958 RepID=UPI0023DA3853|nr:hypothetical protein [Komagataeibacter oboediens]WEQ51182.1 hypothetical protein LV478_11640 [Komagataeibacter oboediens]
MNKSDVKILLYILELHSRADDIQKKLVELSMKVVEIIVSLKKNGIEVSHDILSTDDLMKGISESLESLREQSSEQRNLIALIRKEYPETVINDEK